MAAKRKRTGRKQAPHAISADRTSRRADLPASAEFAPGWLRAVLPVVVAGAAFVVFLPALDADFVNWDDDKLFLNNTQFRGLSWSHLTWMFTTTKMGHWQPLSWVTLGLDYTLYGMKPRGYHLTNILLHAACAAAFYFLALRLLTLAMNTARSRSRLDSPSQSATRNPQSARPSAPLRSRFGLGGMVAHLAAALAALFFAVHPLRTESVAWVTERRDLLSGLFFILTITVYLKSRTVERRRTLWYLTSVALFILSVLSKAWGMTIPAVLIVLDLYPLRRLGDRLGDGFSSAALRVGVEKVPFVVIAALTAWKALAAQTGQLATAKSLAEHPLSHRVAQMAYGALFYVWKTLIPTKLIPLHELTPHLNPWEPRFVLSAVVVVLAVVGLVLLRRRWPAGLALAVAYLAIYSPVSGVAQSGPQLVKDSYSYLCCLSWAALFGGVLLWCYRRGGLKLLIAATGVGVVWVAVLGVASWRQTGIWRDSKTLWTYTLSVDDRCALAHNNLAILFKQEAKYDSQLQEAYAHYERALELDPSDADTHFNYANALKALKRYDEAIEQYQQAIALQKAVRRRPVHEEAHMNLGNTYYTLNRIPEAVEHHLIAAKYRRDPELDERIARELRDLGRLAEAETYFRRALEKRPDYFEARYGLGQLLFQRGACAEALDQLRKAVALKPESESAQNTLRRAQVECRP
jgi:Flp pilus assembly protein TadD